MEKQSIYKTTLDVIGKNVVLYVAKCYVHNNMTYATRCTNLTFCTPTPTFVSSLVPILKQHTKDFENNFFVHALVTACKNTSDRPKAERSNRV